MNLLGQLIGAVVMIAISGLLVAASFWVALKIITLFT